MGRLIKWGFVMMLTLLGFAVGAWQVGVAQPNPALGTLAIIRDSDSNQPACWHEFCPGKTNFREAEAQLRSANLTINDDASELNHRVCWHFKERPTWMGCIYRGYSDLFLWGFSITVPDNTFRLGDALLLYGEPQDVQVCGSTGSAIASLRFPNNLFIETAPLRAQSTLTQPSANPVWRLDPQLAVNYVYLSFEPFAPLINTDATHRWKGFTRGRCTSDPAGTFDE